VKDDWKSSIITMLDPSHPVRMVLDEPGLQPTLLRHLRKAEMLQRLAGGALGISSAVISDWESRNTFDVLSEMAAFAVHLKNRTLTDRSSLHEIANGFLKGEPIDHHTEQGHLRKVAIVFYAELEEAEPDWESGFSPEGPREIAIAHRAHMMAAQRIADETKPDRRKKLPGYELFLLVLIRMAKARGLQTALPSLDDMEGTATDFFDDVKRAVEQAEIAAGVPAESRASARQLHDRISSLKSEGYAN
jgi:hypothetical protein